jgi:hypothetical protein
LKNFAGYEKKGKAVSVNRLWRLTHFLDSRLRDGGEVVSRTGWLASLYPQENFWCPFLLEGCSSAGRLKSIEISIDLIGI